MRRVLCEWFKKPYAKPAWGFFVFFVACFAFYPQELFSFYATADADDLMRLHRVREWMTQGDWYATAADRLGWGGQEGVLPWARLVDLPLAVLAAVFSPFTGLQRALEIAGLIVPPLLLAAGLMPALYGAARCFMPRRMAMLSNVVLFGVGMPLLGRFIPTRVDHHGWQIIFATLSFLFLLQMVLRPRAIRPAIAAGIVFACGLWVGGEIVPALTLFCVSLGILGVLHGGLALRQGGAFGLALAFAAMVLLPVARSPQEWDDLSLTWFSAAYVLFAVLVGLIFILSWAFNGNHVRTRFSVAALDSVGAGLIFFLLVPEARLGPYADLSKESADLILGHVAESRPLYQTIIGRLRWDGEAFANALVALSACAVPLTALVYALWQAYVLQGRRRSLFAIAAFYIGVFFIAAFVWQLRVFVYAQLFAIPVLTVLLHRWMKNLAGEGRLAFWRKTGAFLLVTFLPSVIVPSLLLARPVFPDTALFYARHEKPACDMREAWAFLSSPDGFGAKPVRIANMINEGAGLLFYTPHFVMSAPYTAPTNGTAFALFTARDEDRAKEILGQNNIDLLVVCRRIPVLYAGDTTMPEIASDGGSGLSLLSRAKDPTLAERLAQGKPPFWLRAVSGFSDPDVRVYEKVGQP